MLAGVGTPQRSSVSLTRDEKRIYIGLLALRLFFALRPSYLHQDEHYQSLEPFVARVFPSWQSEGQATWEQDLHQPVHSVVLLWPVLGTLMHGVKAFGGGPRSVFYGSRLLWFVGSLGIGKS
jgi:hypothetical protein